MMWWRWSAWWPVGEDGGSQTGWWLGGEAQNEPNPCVEECGEGEHGIDTWAEALAPLPPVHSDVRSLENIVMASGKWAAWREGAGGHRGTNKKRIKENGAEGGEKKKKTREKKNTEGTENRERERERERDTGERERERDRERER